MADHVALMLGMAVDRYPADWRLGAKAGPMRNERMFREGKPDLVLAFHREIEWSRGTRDVLERAKRWGVPTTLFEK